MQLKALKIFCDVVSRRSFSRAADDNGVSQSSISQVVHQLEERLGVQLLDRSKRPFVLTPEGERYYEGCRQLVKQYAKLEEEVLAMHDESNQRLMVASIYSVGLAHMSAFMQQFAAQYPNARVRLEYLHPDRVYEVVENGEVDLGLVSYPEESRSLTTLAWRNEPLVVVCQADHPLAQRSSLKITELEGQRFVAFEAGLRIRSEIDRELLINKVKVDVALEFDNIETMKRAIEIDEGVSILPAPTVAREVASGTLAAIPLAEKLERPLGIICRRDRSLRAIGEQFVQLLQADADFDYKYYPTQQPNHQTPTPAASAAQEASAVKP